MVDVPREMQAKMLGLMSLQQWSAFLEALGQMKHVGYGELTLSIKRGVVRRMVPAPSIELPDGKDGER